MTGNTIEPLAYFRTERKARLAMDMIDQLAHVGRYSRSEA